MENKLERMTQDLAAAGEPDFVPAVQVIDIDRAFRESLVKARSVIEGLMDIAEMAMPDAYFATDSRVNAARRWLEKN